MSIVFVYRLLNMIPQVHHWKSSADVRQILGLEYPFVEVRAELSFRRISDSTSTLALATTTPLAREISISADVPRTTLATSTKRYYITNQAEVWASTMAVDNTTDSTTQRFETTDTVVCSSNDIPSIPNAAITPLEVKPVYYVGVTLFFTCLSGSSFNQSSFTVCSSNGKWSTETLNLTMCQQSRRRSKISSVISSIVSRFCRRGNNCRKCRWDFFGFWHNARRGRWYDDRFRWRSSPAASADGIVSFLDPIDLICWSTSSSRQFLL